MDNGYVNHIDGDPKNNELSNIEVRSTKPWAPEWQRISGRSSGKAFQLVDFLPQGGTLLCINDAQAVNVRAICLKQNRSDIEVKVLGPGINPSPDPKVGIGLEVVFDECQAMQFFSSVDAHARRALSENCPRVVAKSRNYHDWYSGITGKTT